MSTNLKRYEVFARGRRGEPFYHIGVVEAFSDNLAQILARHIYDEENWFDFAVVRAENIRWVTRNGRDDVPAVEGA
ncbi:MAG: hypothetical protein K6T63_06220 [Alicyclobacillus herbarius]|uniref:hypothetical protein n=1 Tax=Alicyclobacillus herbarius TaxID=122960 RepID=UPI0023536D6A|nr:hypothetical protein [Alicyclobacillus herbarius]MCL6632216.1 hypothetical protein [Alicyclobacillus herbarius]